MVVTPQSFVHDYFSANTSIDRGWLKNGLLAAWTTAEGFPKGKRDVSQTTTAVQAARLARESNRPVTDLEAMPKQEAAVPQQIPPLVRDVSINSANETSSSDERNQMPQRQQHDQDPANPTIPLDASSRLAAVATRLPATASIRRNIAIYLSLTKPRLSFLIVLTTTSAYSLYPMPDIISTTSALAPTTLSTSTLTLLFLTTGTFLSSAAANTLNMLMEPRHDALMARTRNRPLVRNLVTPTAASVFALVTGSTGLMLLSLGTNDTVAFLSALNIFLYAGVYTPLKRTSVLNTWVGAVVGAIPPLMGWAAAAGQAATFEHDSWRDLLFSQNSLGGWLLATLLFAWQFPHFNALAHSVRDDYKRAGFRMMAWTNPALAGRVALRYSLAMFPICFSLYWVGIVNEGFLVLSTACNAWMTREAWRFWKRGGAGGSARGLFWASVWQLPLVLVGALVCKKGLWDGFFSREQVSPDEEGVDAGNPESTESAERTGGTMIPSRDEKHIIADVNLAMLGFKRPS